MKYLSSVIIAAVVFAIIISLSEPASAEMGNGSYEENISNTGG